MKDGLVLAVHERNGNDVFSTPGGGLEAEETLEECVAREVAEETGIIVKPTKCVVTVNEYYEEWRYTTHYFICDAVEECEKHMTDSEIERGLEVLWIEPYKLYEIFSHHADYIDTDEMKRGYYEREYAAMGEWLAHAEK